MSCVVPPKVNRKTQITTKVPWLLKQAIRNLQKKNGREKKKKGFWSGERIIVSFEIEKKLLKIENPCRHCGHYKALPWTDGPSQECSKEDMSK